MAFGPAAHKQVSFGPASLIQYARARHLLFPLIVLVHLVLIALLLLRQPIGVQLEGKGAPLSVFNVEGPPQIVPAPKPVPVEIVMPPPIVKLAREIEVAPAQPVFDPAAAGAAGFGSTCEISETLGLAFEQNPILRQILATWTPDARSVSGAVMLWDGKWVVPSTSIKPETLDFIQRAVVEGISSAPAECLKAEIIGPKFIFVRNDPAETTIIVLGSGTWTWEQILLHDRQVREMRIGEMTPSQPSAPSARQFERQ